MAKIQTLHTHLQQRFESLLQSCVIDRQEVTIEVPAQHLLTVCQALRDEPAFKFEQLIDVAGVDYSQYGLAQWQTQSSTASGFERGVQANIEQRGEWNKPRFAVVYHLLSITHNQRLRLRCFVAEDDMRIASVINIWPSADWFEREAFDLFGILFTDHPDLRRIMTDYGFVGHPFRKDFPMSGHVEVRYDAEQQRVVYEPVDIQPRVLVPKVIRQIPYSSEDTDHG